VVIDRHRLVAAIHESPPLLVAAVTGGGIAAVTDLLAVPGASRTVLEVVVPYSAASLAGWIGHEPAQATSAGTARAMAARALARAAELAPGSDALGLGVTAALVTDRPRRGEHRAHLAIASRRPPPTLWSVTLEKGARDRVEEDRIVSDLALLLVAGACGIAAPGEVPLSAGDRLERSEADAPW
jgi:nicotinamide mononucleotide (NMN) deamidase PncC